MVVSYGKRGRRLQTERTRSPRSHAFAKGAIRFDLFAYRGRKDVKNKSQARFRLGIGTDAGLAPDPEIIAEGLHDGLEESGGLEVPA
jgi:hypothetical protein